MLLLLSVLGYVLVCHSSLFALRSIHVAGAGGDGLSAQRVTQAAALPLGAPLTSLDTAGAQARIERIPQVASARVAVVWPHTVRITVTTRVAAALIPNGSTYDEVDAGGVVFDTVSAPTGHLPVITVQGGPAVQAAIVPGALAALSALGSTAPAIAGEVTGISASSAYSIMLRLSGGVTVDWGGGDAPVLKARDLAALMRYRKASAYNVSAPDAPSVS
ncbi:MAG TPA: FtsQ-type POTRA domain-containing protein [Actinocrinis sp.]|jgi:cell division protein FtsQ